MPLGNSLAVLGMSNSWCPNSPSRLRKWYPLTQMVDCRFVLHRNGFMHHGAVPVFLNMRNQALACVAPRCFARLARLESMTIEMPTKPLTMLVAHHINQCVPNTLSPMTLHVEGNVDKIIAAHETFLVHQDREHLPRECFGNISKHNSCQMELWIASFLRITLTIACGTGRQLAVYNIGPPACRCLPRTRCNLMLRLTIAACAFQIRDIACSCGH